MLKNISHLNKIFHICFFMASLTLSSCMSIQSPPQRVPTVSRKPQPGKRDVYHTVAPGETVWRLAKMYDVKENDIIRANRLRSARDLQMGRRVRIPYASPLKPFIPRIPSKKWKYIIIHHSATDKGNSLQFHKAHLDRGFDRGIGYHFVIDNGTQNKIDGQIEVTPRWIKQQDGAHCKASNMNKTAIGICLVGNFNEERVSKEQLNSLIFLVKELQRQYHIPQRHIKGHGEVLDAHTACPGANFPWKEFWKRL